MKATVLLLTLCVLFTACSSVQTQRNPHVDLGKLKRFYVEHWLSDNHRVDEAIVADLQSRGFDASAGPLTMMPDDVDAIVTYRDEWAWDFKSYLIQLSIHIRSARKEQTLATGTYRQPSPVTKPPAQVIRIILDPFFKQP